LASFGAIFHCHPFFTLSELCQKDFKMNRMDKYPGGSGIIRNSLKLFFLLSVIRSEGRILVFTGTQQGVF
jgi:hypothetical protein